MPFLYCNMWQTLFEFVLNSQFIISKHDTFQLPLFDNSKTCKRTKTNQLITFYSNIFFGVAKQTVTEFLTQHSIYIFKNDSFAIVCF